MLQDNRSMKRLGLIGVAALVLFAAGCGSSSSEKGSTQGGAATSAAASSDGGQSASWKDESVAVGNDISVKVKGPIHLAYFAPGANNSWLQAAIKGAKDAIAKIPGATITVFDANWVPTTQFNQVQNAIQTGRFNAALIDPVDTQLMCKIMTQTAPKAGVLVESITHPLCSKYGAAGTARYVPGTLGYVDANDTVAELKAYMQYIAKSNPGPQQVIAVSGPPSDGMTKNLQQAIAEMKSSGDASNFNVTDVITTDFSLTQAQSKLSALLQSKPDTTIVFSPPTSDVTRGVYSAIQAAGKAGKIKIYEKGGSQWVVDQVKKGAIAGTQPQYPYSNTRIGVEELDKAFTGEPTQKFVPDYGVKYSSQDTAQGFQLFTKDNIASYKPEY